MQTSFLSLASIVCEMYSFLQLKNFNNMNIEIVWVIHLHLKKVKDIMNKYWRRDMCENSELELLPEIS